MNRTMVFDSPFLLGFEPTRALIERAAKAASESYPPYNVEETGEGVLRISLAVAGFTPADLSVTVEDNQLVISGRREEGEQAGRDGEKAYLHRGIATRAFLRTFVLADGMEVVDARLEHGLLHVDLTRKAPAKLVKRIPIKSAG
jgi:HSP20 family molecular chaperone IbpA